ncbi:alpha/beta hydrolase [Micromonospora sp. CPCC 205546]|uniref:alpha/beta hydrolase n=1 Tax=Micromonospora sp. CPCC 205546 TaxID=3122397 RepID=UPI002FF38B09
MNRLLATATVASLLAGALVVSPGAQAAPIPAEHEAYLPPPIAWGRCADPGLQQGGAECGFVQVPLDYDRPRGEKIKIAVSRVRHKTPDAQYQGIMLINPGGPGASGLPLSAVVGGLVPKQAGEAYDWIGFDPRGVGASEPSLSCDGSYFGYRQPFHVPVTGQLERTWLRRTKDYAHACDRAGGRLLDHMKTTDTVKDMDSIRRALREPKLNFYGFSYGSYLGQVYATLYPQRVRRMVLDGNTDPRTVWYQANLNQDVAFDRNLKAYFDWIAEHHDVYRLGRSGGEVERRFYAVQHKLLRAPADGIIGPSELTEAFLPAGYNVYAWQPVAQAFSSYVHDGDVSGIKALYDSSHPQGVGADNGYAVYLAVQCTDVQWPRSWARWKADTWRVFARAPFYTWSNAWYNAPCRHWGAGAGRPVEVDGSAAPPVLLVNETFDAATPYSGALEVRSRFPKSVLIEGVGGTTHASSLGGVACVDDRIADYLLTGALPERRSGRRSDVQCEPVPRPTPAKVAGQRPSSAPALPGADGDAARDQLRRLVAPR